MPPDPAALAETAQQETLESERERLSREETLRRLLDELVSTMLNDIDDKLTPVVRANIRDTELTAALNQIDQLVYAEE